MNREYLLYLIEMNLEQDLKTIVAHEKQSNAQFDLSALVDSATGENLLHYAVRLNNLNMIQTLLELGCNMDAKDKQGKTCFEYGMERLQVPQLLVPEQHGVKKKHKSLGVEQVQELMNANAKNFNHKRQKRLSLVHRLFDSVFT